LSRVHGCLLHDTKTEMAYHTKHYNTLGVSPKATVAEIKKVTNNSLPRSFSFARLLLNRVE
jgi:hypothetical protein